MMKRSADRASDILDDWTDFVWPGTIYKTKHPLYLYEFPWMSKTISCSGHTGAWAKYTDEYGHTWFLMKNSSNTSLLVIEIAESGCEILTYRTVAYVADSGGYVNIVWIHGDYIYWDSTGKSTSTASAYMLHYTNIKTFEDKVVLFSNVASYYLSSYITVADDGTPQELFYWEDYASGDTRGVIFHKKTSSSDQTIASISKSPASALNRLVTKGSHVLWAIPYNSQNYSTSLFDVDLKTGTYVTKHYAKYLDATALSDMPIAVSDVYPVIICQMYSMKTVNNNLQADTETYKFYGYIPDANNSNNILDNIQEITVYTPTQTGFRTSTDGRLPQLINNNLVFLQLSTDPVPMTSGVYDPSHPNRAMVHVTQDIPLSTNLISDMRSQSSSNSWSSNVYSFVNICFRFSSDRQNIIVWSVMKDADVYPYISSSTDRIFRYIGANNIIAIE